MTLYNFISHYLTLMNILIFWQLKMINAIINRILTKINMNQYFTSKKVI